MRRPPLHSPLLSLLALLLPLVLAGCPRVIGSADTVQVRIANESATAFDDVVVGFPDGEEEYGAVEAGGITAYRVVDRAYRYAYIEVRVGADRLVLQPIDYVGETLLAPGLYTYVLGVVPPSSLTLELRRDDR